MACVVYAEGSFDKPIDLFTDSLVKTPTRYYIKVKKTCKDNFVYKENNKYVEFNWENVLQLCTKKQQDAFNIFRNDYIQDLVIGYCHKHGCNPVPVGSAATSARSDIDFNMYSEEKDVDYVIMQINKLHKLKFKDSLDKLFDVNIYGTVVDIFNDLLCGVGRCTGLSKDGTDKQHVWAFLRAAEFIRDYAPEFTLREEHQMIYKKCLKLSKKLSGKVDAQSMYLRNIRIYIRSSKKKTDPSKLAEIYGKTKYYERETYRSVGATLHIVMKKHGLPKSLLKDSVYDNFGFAAEVLLTPPICPNSPKDTRVYKTCKYISRMCNALEEMGVHVERLEDLRDFCDKMNKRKKLMLPFLQTDYKKLCSMIGGPLRFNATKLLQAIYDHLLVC